MFLRIKELRTARQISQVELSEKMNVSQNCVSKWENEEILPACSKLPALADALGVSVGELFVDDESA